MIKMVSILLNGEPYIDLQREAVFSSGYLTATKWSIRSLNESWKKELNCQIGASNN